MESEKSTGPDSFTAIYYKNVKGEISNYFRKAFNIVGLGSKFPVDTLRTHITLVPIEGKDLSACKNFRPILLLNVDLKIFTKILARRVGKLLLELIHQDQVGFVQTQKVTDNIIRTINIMHMARERKISLALLGIDAEKAFNRLNWLYMEEILKRFGLGPRFRKWTGEVYSGHTAQFVF